jgi:hypothetical protein
LSKIDESPYNSVPVLYGQIAPTFVADEQSSCSLILSIWQYQWRYTDGPYMLQRFDADPDPTFCVSGSGPGSGSDPVRVNK